MAGGCDLKTCWRGAAAAWWCRCRCRWWRSRWRWWWRGAEALGWRPNPRYRRSRGWLARSWLAPTPPKAASPRGGGASDLTNFKSQKFRSSSVKSADQEDVEAWQLTVCTYHTVYEMIREAFNLERGTYVYRWHWFFLSASLQRDGRCGSLFAGSTIPCQSTLTHTHTHTHTHTEANETRMNSVAKLNWCVSPCP